MRKRMIRKAAAVRAMALFTMTASIAQQRQGARRSEDPQPKGMMQQNRRRHILKRE